jgi:D-beta-D-heptose 7-phosphate kinase/D-beta-D-heptose 1-phosphate adenosyltransferase
MSRTAPSSSETLAAISSFRGVRVLVVGDLILDSYVRGRVERRSPEAPVPVVDVEEQWDALGGAANVAHQLVALDAHVDLVGVVGDDPNGVALLDCCAEADLDVAGIARVAGRATTRKMRVLADRQQVVRLDWERRDDISADGEDRILAALAGVSRPDAVIISDYGKGLLTERILRAVMDAGRRWGVPVLVDPTRRPLSVYRGARLIKMNRAEFESVALPAAAESPDDLVADMARRAPAMIGDTGVETLVVTLGERGMVVSDGEGTRHHPTRSTDVYDVSGAGDTVIAVLAAASARGVDIDTAAALANMAASVAVRKVGVSVVTGAEVVAEAGSTATERVVSRTDLVDLVRSWRELGRRIVFTNGCFDLLHEGHLALLSAAAQDGDALIVAVNSDASVRDLKGPGRPVVAQSERGAILAALSGVDAVVIFEGHDLEDLLAEVRPDVLVKGADYTLDEVVGRDLVEDAGGKVVLVPLLDGHSTSELVRRLRAAEPDDATSG